MECENTVYTPPSPFFVFWRRSSCKSNSTSVAEKQLFQIDLQPALNFQSVWGNLNIEGNLKRTEAALRGP